jgi:hypothetical protein
MIPIDSDGSIGAKHILLMRAMSMRLYDSTDFMTCNRSECSILVAVRMSHYLFDRGSDVWSKKINERRDIADGLEIQDHVFDRGLAINRNDRARQTPVLVQNLVVRKSTWAGSSRMSDDLAALTTVL